MRRSSRKRSEPSKCVPSTNDSGRSALEIAHERLTREARRRRYWIAAPAAKLGAELGFEEPADFNRLFKRRAGLTPRCWRETQQAAP